MVDSVPKYPTKVQILDTIKPSNFNLDQLISSDSYDESLIMKKLQSIGEEGCYELELCATHIAIIGSGNGNFGLVVIGKDVLEITKIFDKYKVKYKNSLNARLEPDDLTPRRLVRFFRYHISNTIKTKGRSSYLWLKYANRKNDNWHYIYPGAEHRVKDSNKYQEILDTYQNLDKIHGTTFVKRIIRVGIARGILKPDKLTIKNEEQI